MEPTKGELHLEEMDEITLRVSKYFGDKGIMVTTIAEKTGISRSALYKSINENPTRKLRADEFMKICAFLEIDPHRFWCASPGPGA